MANAAYYLTAVIALVAAIYKFLQAKGSQRNPGLWYLCGALVFMAFTVILLAPATLTAASKIEPFPNFTRLLGNGVAMVAAYCMHGMLTHSVESPQRATTLLRRQFAVLLAVLSAMAVLMVIADTEFTVDFVDVYGARPAVAGYLLVFLSYAAWGLVAIIRLVNRYARLSERRYLRLGLQGFVAGAVVGLLWVVWKASVTFIKITTGRPFPSEGPVSGLLSAIAVAILILAATITAWGPVSAIPARWARTYRAYRGIGPLWSAMRAAVPEIVLPTPAARGQRLPLRGLEFALYRRVIEIRDAHLALRGHFHPEVPLWAVETAYEAGIRDAPEVEAIVEAAVIAAALVAKEAGRDFQSDPATTGVAHEVEANVEAETAWLITVARAFTHSPIVDQVRQRLRTELDESPATLT